jgi:hypothetical protein
VPLSMIPLRIARHWNLEAWMTLRRSLPGRRTAVVAVVMAALAAALWLSSGVAQAGPPDHAQGGESAGGPLPHVNAGGPPPHENSGANSEHGNAAAGPTAHASPSGGPPEHASGGARVWRGIWCAQPGGEVDGQVFAISGDDHGQIQVNTPSGNRTLVCLATVEGQSAPSANGGAQLFNFESTNFTCAIIDDPDDPDGPSAITEQWHAVVTPSGMAIMVCQFKHADADNDVESDSAAIDADEIDDD